MSKITDPSQKKKLSLERDCRNTYGENSKASRKSIPAGKAREHRRERRVASEILGHDHLAAASEDIAATAEGDLKTRVKRNRLRGFKKDHDKPLGLVMAQKAARKAARASRKS